MELTPNLSLKKPGLEDYVNVSDLNENADLIDAAVGGAEESLTTHLADDAIHQTSEEIRTDTTTALRTEVVNSLPIVPAKGQIVFLDDVEPSFKGYNGGEWV